jgi:hypothetical protein
MEAAGDPARRDQWLREAEKWVARASERTGKVAITYQPRNEKLARTSAPAE